jgi:cell division protein FtsB
MRRRAAHATKRVIPWQISTLLPRLRVTLAHHSLAAFEAVRTSVLSLGLMLVMVVLIVMLLINFGNQVIQSARLEADRAALHAEVASLAQENAQLQAAVEYAESDVNVERIAREQLNYARADDMVVLPQISLPAPAPAPEPAPALPEPVQVPNWQRWYGALFHEDAP